MINATTQDNEQVLPSHGQARTVRRIGPRAFWALLAVELLLLSGVLIWMLAGSVNNTPVASTKSLASVQQAIWFRLTDGVDDPLIEVEPGVSVRESNVRGFELEGVSYYYYVVGNTNFDPLSRGQVTSDHVEILLEDNSGPMPLVIYTIRQ